MRFLHEPAATAAIECLLASAGRRLALAVLLVLTENLGDDVGDEQVDQDSDAQESGRQGQCLPEGLVDGKRQHLAIRRLPEARAGGRGSVASPAL